MYYSQAITFPKWRGGIAERSRASVFKSFSYKEVCSLNIGGEDKFLFIKSFPKKTEYIVRFIPNRMMPVKSNRFVRWRKYKTRLQQGMDTRKAKSGSTPK